MTPVTSASAARGQTPAKRNRTWRASAVSSHNSETARERERGQPCSQRRWVAGQTKRRDKVGSKLQLTPKKSHRGVRAKTHITQHHAGRLDSPRTRGTQSRLPLIGLSGVSCVIAERGAKWALQPLTHRARYGFKLRWFRSDLLRITRISHRAERIN